MMLNITDIKIRGTVNDESRLKAFVSLTIDHSFAVHDLKIIQGDSRLFVAMPSRQGRDGLYMDVVHPIGSEARHYLEHIILEAYQNHIFDHVS